MISVLKLPHIVKSSKADFLQPRKKVDFKHVRYIPEWYLPKENAGSYEDFMQKFMQQYGSSHRSLKKFVKNIVKCEPCIGVGRHSSVYAIPGIDDYVLKVHKNVKLGFFDFVGKLRKSKNEYYGFNFGQSVADNNNGISVLMKVNGEEYGVKNWFACYTLAKQPTREAVNYYVNHDLMKLSEFPQESFDNIAKKINLLRDMTKSKPDLYNPNNFVIDYKNQKINIVDVGEDNDSFWSCSMEKALCEDRFLCYVGADVISKASKYIKAIKRKIRIAEDSCRKAFVPDYMLSAKCK